MALTGPQKTAIAGMITQEGGLVEFQLAVADAYILATQASAASTLSPAISVTVSSWPTINNFVASSTNITLYKVMTALTNAFAASDATLIGPMFVALYAAVKKHFNL